MALGIIAGLCLIGIILWLALSDSKAEVGRDQVDRYVELTGTRSEMEPGAAVYIDMSNGMLSAYGSVEAQRVLSSIIDCCAGNRAIDFYKLAENKIEALPGGSHTQLYNYVLDAQNYRGQLSAPIEKALTQIVAKGQPALLMTDFEEYSGGMIQQAAYAKTAFISWLAKGYNITFYQWDYLEGSLAKKMFLAVFDDNADALGQMLATAISKSGVPLNRFVLGSNNFAYPMASSYPSLKQGGNYHNASGIDGVTAVIEDGSDVAYKSYSNPSASASGAQAKFASLDWKVGTRAEYYPLGVSWADAVTNAKALQENGVPSSDKFEHLFTNVAIDFQAQDGFDIQGVEVRVFDIQKPLEAILAAGDSTDVETVRTLTEDCPEINEMLTAQIEPIARDGETWQLISIDFDEKFDGTFSAGILGTDVLRANVVISKASPRLAEAHSFFGWPGNMSLANSISEALTSSYASPVGQMIYSYYLRSYGE